MADAIAVLNAGSSSIKFSLFAEADGGLELKARGQVEGIYTAPHFIAKNSAGALLAEKSWGDGVKLGHDGALDHLVGFVRSEFGELRLAGVGHRVVHGGIEHAQPVRVDAKILSALEKYVPLAPLHQPHNLSPIRLLLERRPELVAGRVLRHGLPSYAAARRAVVRVAQVAYRARRASLRFSRTVVRVHRASAPAVRRYGCARRSVVLHLGNGASMCAMAGGRSVASTMGFTAVDGLPMGTRCGSLDPGGDALSDGRAEDGFARHREARLPAVGPAWRVRNLQRHAHLLEASAEPRREDRDRALCLSHRSRARLARRGARRSRRDRIHGRHRREQPARLRERVCNDAAWLGIELDKAANQANGPRISTPASRVAAWVIPTNEELMIARHTQTLLSGTTH